MVEGVSLADRWEALYQGTIAEEDPFHSLLKPDDQRGEVAAWGGPHVTLLDALTCSTPNDFDRIVTGVASRTSPPEITPTDLDLVGRGLLVIRCVSPALDDLRARLVRATRPLVTRQPLADEEVQRAFWWIDRQSERPVEHRAQLDRALQAYRDAGSPPLPGSRHFRLGFLIKLCRERDEATEPKRDERQARLDDFLSLGEPPWYSQPEAST